MNGSLKFRDVGNNNENYHRFDPSRGIPQTFILIFGDDIIHCIIVVRNIQVFF